MSEIQNTIIKTKNIYKSMSSFAEEHFTPLNECDFKIKSTATYVKSSSDDDFRQFNEDINEHYKSKDILINQRVEFQQIYTIEASKPTNIDIKLNYSLEIDEYRCEPKIILLPDSHILYKTHKPKETFRTLVKEINKIKAKNGILINIFDEAMIKNLKAFTKYLYEGKFKKELEFLFLKE